MKKNRRRKTDLNFMENWVDLKKLKILKKYLL